MLIGVAVPTPHIRSVLTYAVPAALHDQCELGRRVLVTLGGRRVVGLISTLQMPASTGFEPKCIIDVLDEHPVVTKAQLALADFVSRYYLVSPGESARLVLPPDTPRQLEHEYHITAKGNSAQVFGPAMGLTKKEIKILEYLSTNGAKTQKQLRTQGITSGKLNQFIEKGLVEKREKKNVRSARQQEWIIAIDGGAPLPKRAPALSAMDAWLRERSTPTQRAQLQATFKGVKGKLKRLEEMGRIKIETSIPKQDLSSHLEAESRSYDLSIHQKQALAQIWNPPHNEHRSFLLEGVTGSGKTEVYLQLLKKELSAGRGAILIVPEISLTPQLLARVNNAIEEEICVLHSGLSPADRRDAWLRLLEGSVRVVIGARSALFAPIAQLGLIIIDEEHDSSLKQNENPRYHGRDIALWRCQNEKAVCVLGSATPSLESRYNVQRGKLHHLLLPERISGTQQLPEVNIIDLRDRATHRPTRKRDASVHEETGPVILSAPLKEALADTLDAGEQSILFLNRRGVASVLLCQSCGEIPQCPSCSVSLTPHQPRPHLLCHQCDHHEPFPKRCPSCHEETLIRVGLGTQRVENEVKALFPDARIARLDRDTVRNKNHLNQILSQMQKRELDILIGTQMIAKGHDFPAIKTVGIISADIALGIPDFRAAERTFSLLTQVAGRAGRGDNLGHVLIQTFNPEHPSIQYAVHHDVTGFAALEMTLRKEWRYPPFWKAALLRIESEKPEQGEQASRLLANFTKQVAQQLIGEEEFLLSGPAPAPIEKRRNKYRFHLLLRTKEHSARSRILNAIYQSDQIAQSIKQTKCRLVLDVDPSDML